MIWKRHGYIACDFNGYLPAAKVGAIYPAGRIDMADYIARLEQRIRRLKSDAHARQNWTRLRFEIEKKGGRWVAENGIVYELKDGVIYQYLADSKQGVSDIIVTALDAEVPYVGVLSVDLQGTPPEKRADLLKELNEQAARSAGATTEIVTIVTKDWLSKISLARWGTIDWARHLRPTKLTLEARKMRGRRFDPDLIYPGDSFEVLA
jgi:hypothetical protein